MYIFFITCCKLTHSVIREATHSHLLTDTRCIKNVCIIKTKASHLDLSPPSLPCHCCCAWAMHTTLISAVSLMCTHVTASIRASGICTAFPSAGSRSSSGTNRKVCHFEVLWYICLWGLLFWFVSFPAPPLWLITSWCADCRWQDCMVWVSLMWRGWLIGNNKGEKGLDRPTWTKGNWLWGVVLTYLIGHVSSFLKWSSQTTQ